MKRLIIVRHGKSDWTNEGLSDLDRPLKLKGVNDAHLMAGRIREKKIVPDLIISSPANRAIHTALIYARELKFKFKNIIIDETLYFSSEDQIVEMVMQQDDSINSLMIVGHNPIFTNIANLYLKKMIENIPTSGYVIFTFSVDHWNEISRQSLLSELIDYPDKN